MAGALALERALPFTPAGVHLAVVDPEVGARRRAVALRTAEEDRLLVGPDNGLLMAAAERFGGVVEAVEISSSPWRLEPVSATFHGRDLFAPVAARLATGEDLSGAGEPMEVDDLVPLELPVARVEDGALVAHVIAADGFGNLLLDATHDLARDVLRLGRPVRVGDRARHLRPHLRRRRPGRAARLRGSEPPLSAGGQRRRRAARAGARRRRRGEAVPVTLGRPRVHLRVCASTNARASVEGHGALRRPVCADADLQA